MAYSLGRNIYLTVRRERRRGHRLLYTDTTDTRSHQYSYTDRVATVEEGDCSSKVLSLDHALTADYLRAIQHS